MAFNLNKNDGPEGSSKSNSKFDLSKSDQPGVVVDPVKGKSKARVYILVGLLVVAIGGWYMVSGNNATSADENEVAVANQTADSVPSSQSSESGKSTQTSLESDALNSEPVVEKTSVNEGALLASLQNKIPVSFDRGATTFSTVDQSVVNDMLKLLSDNAELSLEVRGYASSEGSLEANQSISQARADAFKDYLVSKNVSANRITALGKGIENPIASNQIAMGRKKNRRVEIAIK